MFDVTLKAATLSESDTEFYAVFEQKIAQISKIFAKGPYSEKLWKSGQTLNTQLQDSLSQLSH